MPIELDDIDRVFRAFSDGTRLRILSLLQRREMCVGDLVEVLEVSQPTISRHLAYLRESGLVAVRRQGLWSFYSLREPDGKLHKRLVGSLGDCLDEVAELQLDMDRAEELKQIGGCCPDSGPGTR